LPDIIDDPVKELRGPKCSWPPRSLGPWSPARNFHDTGVMGSCCSWFSDRGQNWRVGQTL